MHYFLPGLDYWFQIDLGRQFHFIYLLINIQIRSSDEIINFLLIVQNVHIFVEVNQIGAQEVVLNVLSFALDGHRGDVIETA